MTSEVSRLAAAFVEQRLPQATGLGIALADLIEDPESFTRTLTEGLRGLADPGYASEQERVAPGSGATLGVRWPLVHAIERALKGPFAESSSSSAWQLIRRLARGANDWISVDSLADVYAAGILAEPFRWAEVEQLVYSQHRMERRLVGSTLARLPYALTPAARRAGAVAAIAPRALAIVAQLIGDADEQVQKSLSWAIREWSRVAPVEAVKLLQAETQIASKSNDGNRTWVIRDALTLIDPGVAAEIRGRLTGIRRRPGATSTSPAGLAAATFLAAGGAADDSLVDRAVAMQGERFARRSA